MQQFAKALIAALFIGISLSPQAQQTSESQQQPSVHIVSMTLAANLPNAQTIARQILSPDQVKNLQSTGMALALNIWRSKENADCFASVGPTSTPANGNGPRSPAWIFWGMSEVINGDKGMVTCERAFQAAVQNMAQSESLSLKELQLAISTTQEPDKPKFPKMKRLPKIVSHFTSGTLNDTGKQLIADELGPRWHEVLDHRKFAAHVILMKGKTLEGKHFCLAEYGVVAKPPEGISAKYPTIVRARWKVVQDKSNGENCSRPLLESALEELRNEYPDMLDGFQGEAGMTYPSITELKKQVVKFDASQNKLRLTPAASLTRTSNVLRCTNQCQNGSCIRTFEDGRKERWQAPRVYNAFMQNWEWDTTTNACGG